MRGGGCEPGRRRRCWGLTGHSLKNTHIKKKCNRTVRLTPSAHSYICHPPVCLVGGAKRSLLMQKLAGACPTRCHGDEINIILFDWSPRFPALLFSRMCSAPLSRLNTVMTFSAERIDSPLKHAACLLIAQRSILILQPQQRRQTGCNLCFLLILTCVQWHAFTHLTKHMTLKMLLKIAFLLTTCNL